MNKKYSRLFSRSRFAVVLIISVFIYSFIFAQPPKENRSRSLSTGEASLDLRLSVLQLENERLFNLLREAEQELVLTKQSLKEFMGPVPRRESGADALSQRIERLQNELRTSRDLTQQLMQEKESFRGKETGLTGQIEDLNAAVSQLKAQKGQEVERLNQKITQLTVQHGQDREQIISQKDSEANLLGLQKEDEINRLKRQLVQLGAEKEQAITEARLKNESEENSLNEKISGLQKELQNSQEICHQFIHEKESLQMQQKDLFAQLKDMENKKSLKELEVASLNEKIRKIEKEFKDSQELSRQLIHELEAFQIQQKQLAVRTNELEGQNSQKAAVIKGLSERMQKLGNDLKESQGLSQELIREKEISKKQHNELSDSYKEIEAKKLILDKQYEKLKEQNVFLKDEYVGVSQKIVGLKQEALGLAKERDALTASLKKAQARTFELESAQEALLEKAQGLSKQIQGQQQKIKSKEDLEKQNKLFSEQVLELKDKTQQLEKRYVGLKEQNKMLKTRFGKSQENTTLHYNLGVLYTQIKDYEKAVSEFTKVLESKPDDVETNYNLGVIYSDYMNDRKKAIEHFKKYLTLAPGDRDAEHVRKYILTWETFDEGMKP